MALQELVIKVLIPKELVPTSYEPVNVTPEDVLEGVTFYGNTKLRRTGILRKAELVVKSSPVEFVKEAPSGTVFTKIVVDPINLQKLELYPGIEDVVYQPSIGFDGISEVKLHALPVEYKDVSDTTALSNDVREGKSFYTADGVRREGTLKVSEVGIDRLQWKCNNMLSLAYEFYKCSDNNIDDVLNGLNTRFVTNMDHMFDGCKHLIDVKSEINMINVTSAIDMFKDCDELTDVNLKNIRTNLVLRDELYFYGKNLTRECLINIVSQLWQEGLVAETRKLTIGSENIAKINDVYVKLIPITESMRDENSNIDKIVPITVCSSGDLGAMTLIAYAESKGWVIE